MFWIRRVIFDGTYCSIGVPHDPADGKTVEVIRDRTDNHRLVPDAHVNRPDIYKGANIRVNVRA